MRRCPVCVPLILIALAAPLTAQIAFYDFNGNLASTDNDPTSVASNMTSGLPFIFGNSRFCTLPVWQSSTPQGPFNNSQAFLEFTVTPQPGVFLSYSSITIESWRGGGNIDQVEFAGIYADEDPGPGGDNFQTLIASADVFPQTSGVGTTVLPLAVMFLQFTDAPVTFRIYFWGNAQSCCSNAEFNKITLQGDPEICTQIGSVTSIPCGFSETLDPVLTLNPLAVGQPLVLTVDSVFPNSPLWIVATIGPFSTINAGGCIFVVNPSNFVVMGPVLTDANGDFSFQSPFAIPLPALGMQLSFQVRVCDITMQTTGPFAPLPDFFSNGIQASVGCP